MRAVIYCRVSTEEETQIHALKGQIKEAIEAVNENHWILVKQYVDEGKSGTTTKKRTEYNHLVADLEENQFDVIVVKSQDRLMRNTKEWYLFLDRLLQYKKKLYFYLERKFYTPEDALITGIKAILAEEYSRELSKKINQAHRSRQQKGSNISITSNTWGYDKVKKEVKINEEEAKIIQFIYQCCIGGLGSRLIAKELEGRGIKNRKGGRFSETTIRRILRNPLYKGTAVMNQRHVDFETKRVVPVKETEWIYHEQMVPAIVTKEIWDRANQKMNERIISNQSSQRGKKKGSHPLAGKIICKQCGSVFWRRTRTNKKGEIIREWSCREYVTRGRKKNPSLTSNKEGGCNNCHIKEQKLEEIIRAISGTVVKEEQLNQVMDGLFHLIQWVRNNPDGMDEDTLKKQLKEIQWKRELLLEKYLEGIIVEELYRSKDDSLRTEYCKKKKQLLRKSQETEEVKRKGMEQLRNEMKQIAEETLYLKWCYERIKQITIDERQIDVMYEDGTNVTILLSEERIEKIEVNVHSEICL